MNQIKALVFDVFGTLLDWRTSIAREVEPLFAARGATVDGLAFADAWRAQYQPSMEEVRSGRIGYAKLDVLHRRNLDIVLRDFGLALDEADRAALNRVWHRLDAWPDVTPGLARLRQRFLLAPCSNAHIGLMVNVARHHGWHFDAILGAEIANDYKPKAAVYTATAAALDLPPSQVMMVAAHSSDLAAAAGAGLRTAFVARPDEYGPGTGEPEAKVPVDVSARSLLALADALGA